MRQPGPRRPALPSAPHSPLLTYVLRDRGEATRSPRRSSYEAIGAGQNAAAATEGAAAVAHGAGEPPVGRGGGAVAGAVAGGAVAGGAVAGGAVAGGAVARRHRPRRLPRAQVADWLTQDANPSTRRSYPLALGLPLTWVATPSPPGRPRPARPRPPGDRAAPARRVRRPARPRPVAIAAIEAGLLRRSLFFSRRPD